MAALRRLLLVPLLLPALVACGGTESGSSSAPTSVVAGPSSVAATPTPTPSVDLTLLGIESQSVGISVFQWSVDHDFTYPADQAEFEKVKLKKPLSEGSKAGYRKVSAKKYEVCLTAYAGSEPVAWAIYDSSTGLYTSAAGAPTEKFCR